MTVGTHPDNTRLYLPSHMTNEERFENDTGNKCVRIVRWDDPKVVVAEGENNVWIAYNGRWYHRAEVDTYFFTEKDIDPGTAIILTCALAEANQ